MIELGKNVATGQMLGYLYQVRLALLLLLESDFSDGQISIEKIDDIAFEESGTSKEKIQAKHHITKQGNLSDTSIDLWRTLNVWIDSIDSILQHNTKLIMITTSKAPKGSASSFLVGDDSAERNVEQAFSILQNIANTHAAETNKKYYDTFQKIDACLMRKMINQIYILPGSTNIENLREKLLLYIRSTSRPSYEEHLCDRLEGWWFDQAIKYLMSDEVMFISQKEVRTFIADIRDEYSADNLPIDIDISNMIDENSLSKDEKIFIEQLKLIGVSQGRISKALSDYYKAFTQRSSWVRNNLLYIGELDKYEERLKDEWERLFYAMEDRINDSEKLLQGVAIEDVKIIYGKDMYEKIQESKEYIRNRCTEAFVVRGSYHILANELKVGWHLDFKDRLKEIFSEQGV